MGGQGNRPPGGQQETSVENRYIIVNQNCLPLAVLEEDIETAEKELSESATKVNQAQVRQLKNIPKN